MKKLALPFLLIVSAASFGQLTIKQAQDSLVTKYHIGASTYFEEFVGHAGYGALVIITADGGAAAFGDGDEGTMLYKTDKSGKVQWKRQVSPKGTEQEPQCVVQDNKGNFYVIMLVYGTTKYRGGCQRIVLINKSGVIGWDKYIGSCQMVNSPTISYARTLPDGRVALRGQIVTKAPPADKDPTYNFWEGWINSAGVLTQKVGGVIDWKNEEWKKFFKPE